MLATTAAMKRLVMDHPADAMKPSTCRCARCGAEYGSTAWQDLRSLCTLSGDDVQSYVVGWPEGRVIEVRACRQCGHAMARTARL